jgi:hypothetical protein
MLCREWLKTDSDGTGRDGTGNFTLAVSRCNGGFVLSTDVLALQSTFHIPTFHLLLFHLVTNMVCVPYQRHLSTVVTRLTSTLQLGLG